MRYLKLFENINQDVIDKDYIEMCFVDFIDEDNFSVYHSNDKQTYSITIDIEPSSNRDKRGTIHEFKERAKLNYEILDKIEDCLTKVKLQYPNIVYNVLDLSGADDQEIRIDLSFESSTAVRYNTNLWFPI